MKITIKLVDRQMQLLKEIETDSDLIGDAATISYKGNIYIYYASSGRFFQDIRFMLADPIVIPE